MPGRDRTRLRGSELRRFYCVRTYAHIHIRNLTMTMSQLFPFLLGRGIRFTTRVRFFAHHRRSKVSNKLEQVVEFLRKQGAEVREVSALQVVYENGFAGITWVDEEGYIAQVVDGESFEPMYELAEFVEAYKKGSGS
jgi:hypothetical protein